MTSAVIVVLITVKRGHFSVSVSVCVCVCVCVCACFFLWARQNPFWRRLVGLLSVIHLHLHSKAHCVRLGWSSPSTDLRLLPALVSLNEMFSRSILQNGVRGVERCDDGAACKSPRGCLVRGGYWRESCLLEPVWAHSV